MADGRSWPSPRLPSGPGWSDSSRLCVSTDEDAAIGQLPPESLGQADRHRPDSTVVAVMLRPRFILNRWFQCAKWFGGAISRRAGSCARSREFRERPRVRDDAL
jgi:hypothetical protein